MPDFLVRKDNSDDIALKSNAKIHLLNLFRYSRLLHDIYPSLYQVDHAFIKGDALSLLAYGELGVRCFSDIDILIPRNVVRTVENILLSKGYIPQMNTLEHRSARILCLTSSHQFMALHKKVKGIRIEVDLNFDIFWGEYTGKRIEIQEFLSDCIELTIYGVKIKTLSPLKAMVQLILHHYKEINSIYHLTGHNCINHNMFKDVYYLWKNNQEAISLDKLYAISSEYEIIPYVFYVLYFTNWIFKDTELQKYVETFRTSEGEAHLDYYGLTEKERKPWKVDFQTRLEADNLYEFIRDDLTEADVEKLERNRRIFG